MRENTPPTESKGRYETGRERKEKKVEKTLRRTEEESEGEGRKMNGVLMTAHITSIETTPCTKLEQYRLTMAQAEKQNAEQ